MALQMLYSVEALLAKEILKSVIVLIVVQFRFRNNAYWCMLQTIMNKTVHVVFCCGVMLETI